MEIKNLQHTDFDTLFNAFQQAFADYDIHFQKEEVRSMLTRRGYQPQLSFAAFHQGHIIAFTLNGIGTFNGIPTAYDTGTGTLPQHRGQGIAARIFTHSLPFLKQAGIEQYLLEVLSNNHKAISVYRHMNFTTTRRFDCYRQTIDRISTPTAPLIAGCTIQPVDLEFMRRSQTFCDFNPSWQNSIESIRRATSQLTLLGATVDGQPAGHCVFDPATGDLTQIAVAPRYRRRGIATHMLRQACEQMTTDFIKVLNIDTDSPTLPSFLSHTNIPLASSQLEMHLPL